MKQLPISSETWPSWFKNILSSKPTQVGCYKRNVTTTTGKRKQKRKQNKRSQKRKTIYRQGG